MSGSNGRMTARNARAPRGAENVDPLTGRELDGLRPDIETADDTTPPPAPEPDVAELHRELAALRAELEERDAIAAAAAAEKTPDFKPVRVWTAGPGMPREKIFVQGVHGGLKPAADGAYYLTTPVLEAAARGALKGRWWVDDIPEGEPPAKCDQCGWTCRSNRAMNQHLNHAHGRPQADG